MLRLTGVTFLQSFRNPSRLRDYSPRIGTSEEGCACYNFYIFFPGDASRAVFEFFYQLKFGNKSSTVCEVGEDRSAGRTAMVVRYEVCDAFLAEYL